MLCLVFCCSRSQLEGFYRFYSSLIKHAVCSVPSSPFSLLPPLPSLLPPASLQCSCTHTFRIKTDETSRSLDQADDEMQRYLCIVDCRWMTSYLSMSDVCDDVTRAMWGHDVDLTWQVLPTISSAVFLVKIVIQSVFSIFFNRQLQCMLSLHRLNEDAQFPFYSVLFF